MAEKSSFVMYNEWGDAIDLMSYEQKGMILEALLNYNRGLEVSFDADPSLKFIFAMFKQRIDSDRERYQKVCGAKAAAGTKGGEAKAAKQNVAEASKASICQEDVAEASICQQNLANVADSDSDSDSESDSDSGFDLDSGSEKDSEKQNIKTIVEYLNGVIGAHYKPDTPKTVSLIKARMREGFTVDDFKTVIDKKAAHWARDGDMQKYLRPETLFGTKFEGYLNEHDKLTMREEVDSWV